MDIVVLIALPVVLILSLIAWQIYTLRLLPGKITGVDINDIPFEQSQTLAEAEISLAKLGFRTKTQITRSPLLAGHTFGIYGTIMHHVETNTWAMAYIESPAHPILSWRLYLLTPTDTNGIVTFSGGEHTADLGSLGFDIEDAMQYLPTKQWDHHLSRLQKLTPPTNLLDLNTVIEQFNTLFFEGAIQTGHLVSEGDSYRIPLPSGIALYFSTLRHNHKLKIEKKKALAQGLATTNTFSSVDSDYEAYLANKEQIASKRLDSSKKTKYLIISVVLFALSFYFFAAFETILIIIAVLFVHEAGHLLGMRLFGYKDLSMLFIPFLGALANGKKEKVNTWQEALILLSGPLPGYIAGIYILALQSESTPSWLVEYGWISLILNALNLLPFLPLDGGKVVSLALFNRLPFLQLGMTVLSIIAIGYFGLTTGNSYILIIPVFLILSLPTVWAETHLLRESLHLKLHKQSTDKKSLIQAISSNKHWANLSAPTKWQVLDSLSFRLQHASTSILSAGLIFVLWVSTIAVPLTMAVPYMGDILINHLLFESEKETTMLLQKNYDTAESDFDKALFSERLATHYYYAPNNKQKAEQYWEISKDLVFYGDLNDEQKGDRLRSLALSCEDLEPDTNCGANYFGSAIHQYEKSNATEKLISTYQSAVENESVSVDNNLIMLDNAERVIGSDPEFVELLITNHVLRAQVLEGGGKIAEAKYSLKEAAQLSLQHTPEFAYYEQTLYINFLNRHGLSQEAIDTTRAWIESNQQSKSPSLYANLNYVMAWLLIDTDPTLAMTYLDSIIQVEDFEQIELFVARAMLRQKAGLPFEDKDTLNHLLEAENASYWWLGFTPYISHPFDPTLYDEHEEAEGNLLAINWYKQLKAHLKHDEYQALRELTPSYDVYE